MPVAVSLSWSATLLDVLVVEGDLAVDGVPLVRDGRATAPAHGKLGALDYEMHDTPLPERLQRARLDPTLFGYGLGALGLHLAVVLSALAIPPRTPASARRRAAPPRIARVTAPARDPVEHPPDVGHDRAGTTSAGAGKVGTGAAVARSALASVADTGEEPQLSKADAIARARTAGILGTALVAEDTLRAVTGEDRLTSGFDDRTVESGAGDQGFGAAPTGGYSHGDTLGHGWGGSIAPVPMAPPSWSTHDYGYVPHRVRASPSSRVVLCPVRSACLVEGAIDPATVRRYVHRQVTRIMYCYERELLRQPELAGIVDVSFEIGGDGKVLAADARGVDRTVAGCIGETIAAIAFPAGVTQVRYQIGLSPPWTRP